MIWTSWRANVLQPLPAHKGRNVNFFHPCMTHLGDVRRTFLIRDVMDEMLLNGLTPDRVFLELSITHCMRASRIGDCFYYYNEMQRRGMQPSSKLQGLLISVLSREGHLKAAEEVMELSLCCPRDQLTGRPMALSRWHDMGMRHPACIR